MATQPINYMINVPDPTQDVMRGIQQGVSLAGGMAGLKTQKAQQELAQAKQGQVEQEQMQFQALQRDLSGLAANTNPSAKDFTDVMIKHPQLAGHLKQSYDVKSQAQKDQAIKESSSIYSAIQSGNTPLAIKMLEQKQEAAENSGLTTEADGAKAMIQIINMNPDAAKTTAGLFLASSMGADKFPEMFDKINKPSGLYSVLTNEQKKSLGLPENVAFQMSPKGQITEVGSKGVSVNIEGQPQFGTIPPGYQITKEGDSFRMEAIPGSPAEAKVKALADVKTKAKVQEARSGGIVLKDLERLKQKVEDAPWYSGVTGVQGALLSYIPGTNRVDAEGLLETITANIGFDKLQAMREASPTGGALGAISDRELSNLQAVMGNLSLSQSEGQLLENVDRLNGVYKKILKKAEGYPNASQFGFDLTEENKQDIFKKYGIK